jgi:exodeoxyribonuclease III
MEQLRIISYNVNGVRAAMKKGLMEWLTSNPADIICLQETKANQENVDHQQFTNLGFQQYWFSANKKGYSGVAVFSKIPADKVYYGNGYMQSDAEGRVLRLDIDDITLINAYFPSGTSGDVRQTYKYEWLDEFFEYVQLLRSERPKIILCGDYNIAHKEIDIHDPKSNKNSSGFLPEERAWMDKFLSYNWIDTFRVFHPEPHRYSWWSQRFPSVRLNNKGWRIDYISVTENLRKNLKDADIFPDIKFSDHCPVYLALKTS